MQALEKPFGTELELEPEVQSEVQQMDKQTEILTILETMKDIPKEIKGINKSIGTLNTNVAVMGQKVKTIEKDQNNCKEERVKKEDEFDGRIDRLTTNGATAKAERKWFSKISDKAIMIVCLIVYAIIIWSIKGA